MSLVLHPHVAPPGRLRVWVGAFDRAVAPVLKWTADGVVAVPLVIRNLQSIRDNSLLAKAAAARVWSGVYELTLASGVHEITCTADADAVTLRTRTLPMSFDHLTGPSGDFRVLLASCFHRDQDREGIAASVCRRMTGPTGVDLTVLMGDQVYLDMPAWKNFPIDAKELATRFERDYTANWLDPRYNPILDAAPTAYCPDDHEYWNNFPAKSPLIQNSWTQAGRDAWTKAAYAMYLGFQVGRVDPRQPLQFDIPPLSFMIADTRSFRSKNDRTALLAPGCLAMIQTWVNKVNSNRWHGVFVTGQSLWLEPASQLAGRLADLEMSNYDEYRPLVRTLIGLQRDAIWITGDVHWGRFLESRDTRDSRAVFEIACSPASLVWGGMPSVVDRIRSGLSDDPWPLHSDARKPVGELAKPVVAPRTIRVQTGWRGQRGNQLALLAFRKVGDHLEAQLEFWAVRSNVFKADQVASFALH